MMNCRLSFSSLIPANYLVRLACKACDILNGVKLISPRWRVLYIDLVLTSRLSCF